jgi:hypothetical protein
MWNARRGICTEEIYYLYNANSSSSCTVMNGRKIRGQRDGRYGRKWEGPNLRYLPGIQKITKTCNLILWPRFKVRTS